MADAFETIGWVLSVKDKATTAVDKITKAVDTKVTDAAHSVIDLSRRLTEWGNARGPVAKSFAFVGRSFVNVIGSGALEAADKVTQGMGATVKALVDGLANGISGPLASAEKSIRAFPGAVKAPFQKVGDLFTKLGSFIKAEWRGEHQEYFFGDLFVSGAEGVSKLTKSFATFTGGVLKNAKAVGGSTLAAGWATLSKAWAKMFGPKADLDMKKMSRDFSSFGEPATKLEKFIHGVKKVGGFFGVLLGPFAPLLRPFESLIEMISDAFLPAMDTFSSIVHTAFGPFEMILEVIAQNLAQQIKPLLGPLASFLEVAAVELGDIIAQAIKGKNLPSFIAGLTPLLNSVLDIFKAIAPLLPEVLGLGLELTKVLLKVTNELVSAAVPFLKEWLPVITEFVKDIASRVAEFFGPNLKKYVNDFKVLFIDPIADTIFGLWKKVTDFVVDIVTSFGINDEDIRGLTGAIVAAVTSPIETAKAGVNKLIGGFNSLMSADLPLIGKLKDLNIIKGLGLDQIPMLAKGGIAQGPAIIGEAGPELALPLKPEVVERTLAPLIPDIKFPALDRLVDIASNIERVLTTGTLRTQSADMERERDNGRSDIAMAPGMVGGGSW